MAKTPKKLAPTEQFLLALMRDMETAYADDDEQIKRIREVRELRRPVPLAAKHRLVQVEVRDPTITDEIARVVATFSINRPKLIVTPTKPTDAAQTNATLRERWSESVLFEAGARYDGMTTISRLIDAVVADGAGWVKLLPNKDTWGERYKLTPKQFTTEVDAPDDETEGLEDPGAESVDDLAVDLSDVVPGPAGKLKVTDWGAYNQATDDAKKSAGVPFEFVAVDALTVYPVWEDQKIGAVLEVSERPLSSTFRKYRLEERNGKIVKLDTLPEEMGERQPVGTSTQTTVKFVEFHDDTWTTYMVVGGHNTSNPQGAIVAQWEHKMGRHPYFWAPGLWMNHWRNKKVGWSISEAKRWLVEYRSFLMTVHAQIAARDAFTPLYRRLDATAPTTIGHDNKPMNEETWTLGRIYDGKPGEQLEPIRFPPVAQSLREEISMVSDAIKNLDTPRVNADVGGGVEGAGYAINTILTEARSRHAPIKISIERCLKEVTEFLWKLVREKIKEPVWVYRDGTKDTGWLKAGPEDLTETVPISWVLDPEMPSAKLIENRYWTERIQNGTASVDMAIEAMGDNPDEVRLGQILDHLRQSPWYKNYLERYVLSRAERGDLLKEAAEAEQMAKTGAVPGPQGQGPVPQGAPAGMGAGFQGAPGGTPNVPNQGNLSMAPHGAGAVPTHGPGGTSGAGPGAVVPQRAAAAGIQSMNIGR